MILDIDGIGPAKLLNLLSKFKSLDGLLGANFNSLITIKGISNNLANRILSKVGKYRDQRRLMESELEALSKKNIKWITFWSKNYPENLKEIFAPPIILYYKGSFEKQDSNSLAIVGTRSASIYGKTYAEKFSRELCKCGITIVSGMARGIDTYAHRGALSVGGKTLAILGSGLDYPYPPENKYLCDEIAEKGSVISEFPLGTQPDAQNFPKRNRIISGISLGTLVIETKTKGGAKQTASLALEQNREVFAVPGNLGIVQSEGTNLLIQKGEAKLVMNCNDILVELGLKIVPEAKTNTPEEIMDLNLFERSILDLLTKEPKHIDKISTEANMSASDCLVNLLSLEFKDYVKQLPGKTFIRN
ncbi:MAG: DNA-processing protein DprA [Melioribacteraceae bacterium]|nr:DNA-processing protein DprA [Melioribacteraceae bacterium]